jgi:hypothetical protein
MATDIAKTSFVAIGASEIQVIIIFKEIAEF